MNSKVFLRRTIIAIIAVFCLFTYNWTDFKLALWVGYIFYFICFAMYVKALYMALSKTKKVTADMLVVVVMIVSLLAGQPLSGAMVAWFISMGLAISFSIIEKTRKRIETLTKERHKIVRVLRDGTIMELPVEEVCKGETVIVSQGEMIPVDGQIMEGTSSIDESVITGEPFPIFKEVGNDVVSGAINLTSQLSIQATKDGDKGYLQVMAKEIEEHLKVKPKIHRIADKVVQIFISGVVLYAAIVFLVTAKLSGSYSMGLIRMAAVTAVACPCAWALSVPTAFAASIGGLSRKGILVNGGIPLETIGQASIVVLDKTGTVTLAEPEIAGIKSFGISKDELLQIAASVEVGFNHPIANAIVTYASSQGVQPLKVESSEYLPGLGVKSFMEGKEIFLGSTETVKSLGMLVPENVEVEGRATWIGMDNEIVGVISIQDELRDYAKGLARALHNKGIKKVILATGDSEEEEVRRVAQLIEADSYHWGLKPDNKVSLVKELKEEGITVMVGDGVNDSTALAVADVGVSIGHTKADLAIKSSDIVVLRNDATGLISIVDVGQKLIRVIKQNYAWAIGFNVVGIGLATAGILTPWLAALFHHFSSVLVVFNSSRLAKE